MKNIKYILPVVVLLSGFVLATTAFAATYFANPRASTALATSSPVYMTPGAATTTVTYDAYGVNGSFQNTNGTGNTFAPEETALFVQFTASSSATSKLNINFEYSDDNVDWYEDTVTNVYTYSTTSQPLVLSYVPQYSWVFSSSTIGQAIATSSNNRDTRMIKIKPLTRYTRAIATCAAGGTNCAVWMSFLPRKLQ